MARDGLETRPVSARSPMRSFSQNSISWRTRRSNSASRPQAIGAAVGWAVARIQSCPKTGMGRDAAGPAVSSPDAVEALDRGRRAEPGHGDATTATGLVVSSPSESRDWAECVRTGGAVRPSPSVANARPAAAAG
ncbi:MAG: hypothetical protein M1815_003227 [Lichina confinis]|nr:MAG: hypothetical protein M1815_003227 [Lichina confinis]